MAEGKKTFIFYSDWINMVREMPNEDAGELIKHILSYVNDENPETKNILVKMAFGHMKPMIKSDLVKWDIQLKKYSEMGKASAAKRNNPTKSNTGSTQVKPTSTVNVNVNENVTVNDNKKEKERAFDIFWTIYDKKLNRKKCLKKFLSLDRAEISRIGATIKQYISSTPDKQYRKNPITYLNNECWNDEIIIKNEKITSQESTNSLGAAANELIKELKTN